MKNSPDIKIQTYPKNLKTPVSNYGKSNIEQESFGGIVAPGTGSRGHGDDFLELLLDLADEMDNNGMHSEANMIDLLIKNASYNVNYFNKIKGLLNKQYISDPENIKNFGKELYDQYSKALSETNNSQTAARISYNFFLKDNIQKTAGTLEQDPIYVADSIVKIIKIMVSMISPEKRPDSFRNIKNRVLEDFDPAVISDKKSPGGAAVGVSLALIKNILNSRDQMFIRLVLDEIRKKIGY